MILEERTFETTVNVPNPIAFCTDVGANLLAALRGRYEGRCFGGAYVLAVKAVTARSRCALATTNASAEGSIDVEFRADVAVVETWDILVGVVITRNETVVLGAYGMEDAPESGGAGARRPRVVVQFAPRAGEGAASDLALLSQGQRVCVRVVVAIHTALREVSAVVQLLTCERRAAVYRVPEGDRLDAAGLAEVAGLATRIRAELGCRAALAADPAARKRLWYFEALLCSVRLGAKAPDSTVAVAGAPPWEGPGALDAGGEGAIVNVVDTAGSAEPLGGLWYRPLSFCRSAPVAVRAPGTIAGAVVEASARTVMREFLKNILDFITATREMAQLYTEDDIEAGYASLWAAARRAQVR
jgi:hypothetical protein